MTKTVLIRYRMAATVTWLGGQGDERRQPRLGGSNPEDTSFFPPQEAGRFFPPHLRRSQRLRMPSSALHRMVFRAQRPGPRAF